ncbi:hypothetical protein [Spiroplasma poulsonii]|nr:hypothetical protein [Spiroplasma poulsonii]
MNDFILLLRKNNNKYKMSYYKYHLKVIRIAIDSLINGKIK